MVADFVVIESVQRVAQLEHDVVGCVNDVVDAGDAGGFEAVLEPLRGRLNFGATNHTSRKAAAEFGRLDIDAHGIAGFCSGTLGRLGRNRLQGKLVNGADFSRDAVVAEAVWTIGGNFRVNHRAVRAIFNAADVSATESESPSELIGRR